MQAGLRKKQRLTNWCTILIFGNIKGDDLPDCIYSDLYGGSVRVLLHMSICRANVKS